MLKDSKGRELIEGAWYAANVGDQASLGSAPLGQWDGAALFLDEEGEPIRFYDPDFGYVLEPDYAILQHCEAASRACVNP